MEIESTLGKYCPIWGLIDAVKREPKEVAVICEEQCANFSKAFNTCILQVDIYTRNAKLV